MNIAEIREELKELRKAGVAFKENKGLSDDEIWTMYATMWERQKKLLFSVLKLQNDEELIKHVQKGLRNTPLRMPTTEQYKIGLTDLFRAGYDMSYDIGVKSDFAKPYDNAVTHITVSWISSPSTKWVVKWYLNETIQFPWRQRAFVDLPVEIAKIVRENDILGELKHVTWDRLGTNSPHPYMSLEAALWPVLIQYILGDNYTDVQLFNPSGRVHFLRDKKHYDAMKYMEWLMGIEVIGTDTLRYTVKE